MKRLVMSKNAQTYETMFKFTKLTKVNCLCTHNDKHKIHV